MSVFVYTYFDRGGGADFKNLETFFFCSVCPYMQALAGIPNFFIPCNSKHGSGKTLWKEATKVSHKLAGLPGCNFDYMFTVSDHRWLGDWAREEAIHKTTAVIIVYFHYRAFLYNCGGYGLVSFLLVDVYFSCQLNSPYMISLQYII